MEHVSEIGPAIVEWGNRETYVDNVILTFMSTDEVPRSKLAFLLNSHSKAFDASQYLEVNLTFERKQKVKQSLFLTEFVRQLRYPVLGPLIIRTMLDSQRKKKLNTMIVKPVQVLGKKKNKEFHFGGLAYWELFTMK